MDSLKQSIKTASRHGSGLAVMFLDLNGFKQINDSYGHNVGDQLLKTVANFLKDCLCESDMVARLGGDEFVVILEDVKHADDAANVAKKILQKFCTEIRIGEYKIQAGTSIGIALFPDDGSNDSERLRHADAAMYLAKKSESTHLQYYSEIARKGNSVSTNVM